MNLVRLHNPSYNANSVLVNDLLNNFLKNDYHENYVSNCKTKPATNVFETEKDFKIEVLLPGFKKEDLVMIYKDNLLTIKVEKDDTKENEGVEYKYARREFGASSFEKQYRIPKSVNAENISAKFENGILNILLPKKEEALEKEPVEIKIS